MTLTIVPEILIPQLYNICRDHDNLTIEEYMQESMEFINENSNEEREEIAFQDKNNFAARNLGDTICLTLCNRRRNNANP
jgi:hypothetical protein